MPGQSSVGQATARSVALVGLDAHWVEVEVDSAKGVSNFRMVGLPETAVRESQARVRSALCHLGVLLGEYNLTVTWMRSSRMPTSPATASQKTSTQVCSTRSRIRRGRCQ